MQADEILRSYIPKLLWEKLNHPEGYIVGSKEYNDRWNLIQTQGDYISKVLLSIVELLVDAEGNVDIGNGFYITRQDLLDGALDGRYYVQSALQGGALDGRYYTKEELEAGALDDQYVRKGDPTGVEFTGNINWGNVIGAPAAFSDSAIQAMIAAYGLSTAEVESLITNNTINAAGVQALIEQYGLSSEEVLQLIAANGMSAQDITDMINGMISRGELVDNQMLQNLAFQWADDVLALITTTYIDANGVWTNNVYTNHIIAGTALIKDALIESISADKITGDLIIGNTVIINQLSAQKGSIAELTVDQIDTSDFVQRYLAGDTSPVGYWKGYDQTIDFYEAVIATGTIQVTDRLNRPIYWVDETHEGTTNDVTAFPVMRYIYNGPEGKGVVKLKWFHEIDPVTGFATPKMIWGQGSGTGNNQKGYLYKDNDGFKMEYIDNTGKMSAVQIGSFVDANHRRLKSCAINRTAGTVTVLAEGQTADQAIVINMLVGTNNVTYTWPDGFISTVSITT